MRDEDFLARIGGEEFAIILPACWGDEPCGSLSQFVQLLKRLEVHYEQEVLCFTVSIGVAESANMTQMQRMSLNAQIKPCTVPSKQDETEFTLPTKTYLKTQHKVLKKITSLINIIAASST